MRDLTAVRVTGGGRAMVLSDATGVEYVVPLDARFRETLGQSLVWAQEQQPQDARAPSKEAGMESSLRPRDIQARIRAGESAEDVAAVAGTSVEKVMIFAGPVLAERAHVAQSAQSASVRRRSADVSSQVRTLGPAASMRLRDSGVDPESVHWDAWRREDGRWTLTAAYQHDARDRSARFSFDQPGHFVTADDDEGRWLVGDGPFVEGAAPATAEPVVEEPAPRLRLAPDSRYPAATELGDDALELVSEGDADWMADVRPPRQAEHDPAQEALPLEEEIPEQRGERAATAEQAPVEQEPEPAPPTQLRPEPKPRKNRARASVPSWDEIMFGGGSGD